MNQKYIDMIYYDNHLEHHGILGQKWGVENGPPYPLGRDVQSMLSNGASYHSIKKAIKTNAKDAKKEAKTLHKESEMNIHKEYANDIGNLEKKYTVQDKDGNTYTDYNDGYKNDLDKIENKYQDRYNKEDKKFSDRQEEIKQLKNSQIKELEKATNREGLNKALKIAGVAAGVAAVAGVSYLAAKKIGKELDDNDEHNGLFGAAKFNRANIAEKIAKDKNSAKGWHEGIQEKINAQRDIADHKYNRDTKILRAGGDIFDMIAQESGDKSTKDLIDKKTSAGNKRIRNMGELDSSKSIRDKAATRLLDKYEENANNKIQRYIDSREKQLEAKGLEIAKKRAQVNRAQVGRASVDRDSNNKKSNR